MPCASRRCAAALLAAVFGAACVLFLVWPEIDLQVAALFHVPGTGFPAQSNATLGLLRETIWNLSIVLALTALAGGLVFAFTRRDLFGVPGGVWQFVALLYLLGPGLLVNGVLKSLWGRARPDQIVEFGGTASFSPAWVISDQCARNCSFVSGEGAGGAALVIGGLVVLMALRRRLGGPVLWIAQGALIAAGLTGAAMRVGFGRHFLSDTVFAALLVGLIAIALWPLVSRGGVALTRKR